MRSQWRFVGLMLLVALAGGCDSVAPLQVEQQTYQLRVTGTGVGNVRFFNVYDVYEEGDGTRYLFCEYPSQNIQFPPTSVPWQFSIQVEILRAGETEPEIITSTAALDPTTNLTLYDTTSVGGLGDKASVTIGDPPNQRTFHFENPRRLSRLNRDVMMATYNPLSAAPGSTYGEIGQGLCSNAYPGPTNIDGGDQPLTIVLNKGDTIIVQARKNDLAPPGVSFLVTEPTLRGELLLDGNTVSVRGNNSSSSDTGAGFSFSFTSL